MSDEEQTFQWALKIIRASLLKLAAPANEQIEHIKALGVGDCADELALEFDDAFKPLSGYFGTGRLTMEAEKSLAAVDQALVAMSGQDKAHLWTLSALSDRSEWRNIRNLSGFAIKQLPS